jgi:serine/threonine protein kinase
MNTFDHRAALLTIGCIVLFVVVRWILKRPKATPPRVPTVQTYQSPLLQNPTNSGGTFPGKKSSQKTSTASPFDTIDFGFTPQRTVHTTARTAPHQKARSTSTQLQYMPAIYAQGGEATIHETRDPYLLVKKFSDHATSPIEFMKTLVRKEQFLKKFPVGLPTNVVGPEQLIYEQGSFVGYSMRRVHGEPLSSVFEDPKSRLSVSQALPLLAKLHTTLTALHRAGMVVGDLHPGNIIVQKNTHGQYEPFIIDVDSMHTYGEKHVCCMPKYMPPEYVRLSDEYELEFAGSQSPETDWYAFAVIVAQVLTFVHPYEGVAGKYSWSDRYVHNISFFHTAFARQPQQRLFSELPPDIVQYLRMVFTKQQRSVPSVLLFLES